MNDGNDTKSVSKEANKWRSDEDGEGENGVDQSDVDVADADVLEDIVILQTRWWSMPTS